MGCFCVLCGAREEGRFDACPACRYGGSCCDDRDQVVVQINVQELRVLAVWARRWCEHAKLSTRLVYSITRRIHRQRNINPPLCYAGEGDRLRDDAAAVELMQPEEWPTAEIAGPRPLRRGPQRSSREPRGERAPVEARRADR